MMTAGAPEPRRQPMAEINVTPLVDVVLVLLIIFMVTAPFLQGGLDIDLPKVSAQGLDMREGLTLTIDPSGDVSIDRQTVRLSDLGKVLEQRGAASRPVFLRADARVPYGVVAQVIGKARAAGVTNLGLVTEPESEGRRR
ncbi:MAG: ExbD/TolR family protein [Candidatus Eiseniibacteriota bacterium]